MFSNSIDCEIFGYGGKIFEKNFKSYSNNR